MSDTWTRYYDAVGDEPRETLMFALDRFQRKPAEPEARFAVDLGCGSGRDTLQLLAQGWRVLAVDSEPEGIERLLQRVAGGDLAARLSTHIARFEDASWPEADLVNSSYALPFCPPDCFDAVWKRIVASLRPGGRFCGQLFGDRDEWARRSPASDREWASPSGMSFHSRNEVLSLLDGLEVERLHEVDEDGTTAVGDAKHWHFFHVVARKP